MPIKMGSLGLMVLSVWMSAVAFARPKISLSYPDCFPQCAAADQHRLLLSGATEQPVIAAMAQAQKEIRFSIYTFSRIPIFKALIEANAQRGVRLRGLVDRAQLANLEPYCRDGACDLSALLPNVNFSVLSIRERLALLEPLAIYQQATLVGRLALLSWRHEDEIAIRVGAGKSRLMHNKFLVVDDQILQTSSGNWSSTAMSVNFENTLEYRAPEDQSVIAAFACAFDTIWQRPEAGTAVGLAQCSLQDHIHFTPATMSSAHIEQRILRAVTEAQRTIDISMHHLAHPEVYERLAIAAQRGVQIRLLFDDDDCPNWQIPALYQLTKTYPGRVSVRYLPTQCKINQLSHNRFGIFDDELLINGSANWSQAGLRSNYETFQIYQEPGVLEAFRGQFERLFTAGLSRSECRCRLERVECRERYCRGEFNPF